MLPKVLFFLGPPASGKGTQCKMLTEKLNVLHLSAGELLRKELGSRSAEAKLIESCMKDAKIVPVEVTCALLRREIEINRDKYKAVLIDGFPRNFDNFVGWKRTMTSRTELLSTLVLDCLEKTITNRLHARLNSEKRMDDDLEIFKKRIEFYNQFTLPVLEKLSEMAEVKRFKAEEHPEEINKKIISYLEKFNLI